MVKVFPFPPRGFHLIPVELREFLAFSFFLFCTELKQCTATNGKHKIFTSI